MNPQKVDEARTPPNVWIDVLDEYDRELTRVRLYWRRGKSRYRPLLRAGADPGELENAPMSMWDSRELAESNLVWVIEADETPENRVRRLEKLATHFWNLAVEWTKLYGPVCDFQLRGYGEDQGILFEIGKRCHLGHTRGAGAEGGATDEPVPADEHDRDREFMRRREDRLLGDFDQVHRTYGGLLGRLERERNEALETTQETSRITPTLLSSAGELLKDAVKYNRESVDRLLDQATGKRELEAMEFREQHRSYRQGQAFTFARDMVLAVIGGVGPLAVQLTEIWTSRMSHAVPEFRSAQQAIAYLHLTLSETQLRGLFTSMESIRSFNETLAEAAKVADEREAIASLHGLERLFRSKAWMELATAEQQIAARFIVGRAAIYRMEAFGE